MEKKTVVLCDDHNIVRAGLRQIVESFGDFEVLDDVASGEALFPLFRKQTPDILLLDISLPGRSGLEVLKQIQYLYPEVAVLALSMYPEDQFAIRMIKPVPGATCTRTPLRRSWKMPCGPSSRESNTSVPN